jgi:hypothetical protein
MKRIFMFMVMVAFTLIMVSCDKEKKPRTDDINDEDIIETDTETDDDPVIETDDDPVVPDEDICTLNQDWLAPDSAWAAWGYLRMSGGVGEYQGDYVEATFTEGKMKIASGTTDLEYGSYMNYQGTTLLADAVAYEFLNVNQTAGTALIDYYDAMWQFNAQIIPLFKEDGAREADFAAFVWFRHTFIDVNFNASGQVTEQRVRKNCWYALAATEEVEEEGETYDVPVGGIYGCFDENVDGSVGETLKMMFRNKMTDDRADLLAFINTLEDGTVLEYGDEGFKFECECYTELGATDVAGENEVACWQYDGPGEGEDCPPEVEAAGKCDEGAADDDIVDEDIIDEDTTDEDPYVDPCLPTNPCVEANKTVCTDANEDGVEECACVATYHLEEAACVSNTKNVPCDQTDVVVPANATIVVADVEVTWNETAWTAPAKCVWACNATYHTEDNETCESNTKNVSCDQTGVTIPENGEIVVADVEVTWNGTDWNAPAKCIWQCKTGYEQNGETCINEKQVLCDPLDVVAPNNAHVADDQMVTVTYDGTSWGSPEKCDWVCNEHYDKNVDKCDPKIITTACTNIPENGHGTDSNSEGTITQIWNGTEYEPSADTCVWDCDANFDKVGELCEAQTRDEVCGNEIPANSSYSGDGTFTQTWSAEDDDWMPAPADANCAWVCDEGYKPNEAGTACEEWIVIYVDQTKTAGANTGYNWTDAFTSLHAAFEIAMEGQEIWIAEGTYYPEACPFYRYETDCDNQRNMHFRLVPNVKVFGGFAGTEILATDRVPGNTVVLSGDLDGDDSWNEMTLEWENRTDNVYNVFRIDYEATYDAATTVIDGVTITGGHADVTEGGENFNAFGGAIQLHNKSITIENSSISGNYAALGGGAILANEGSTVILENTHFDSNTNLVSDIPEDFSTGGAIFLNDGTLTITDCEFTGNRSITGGALNIQGVQLVITDTVFENNYAEKSSGAINKWDDVDTFNVTITGSTFSGNATSLDTSINRDGGAMNLNRGVITIENTVFDSNTSPNSPAFKLNMPEAGSKLLNCVFTNNDAVFTDNSDNSAVEITQGHLTVENCDFIENGANGLRSRESTLVVESSTFSGNVGSMGAGISSVGGPLTINNSFFDNNQATVDVGGLSMLGGAISMIGMDFETGTPYENIPARITNTVFVNNEAGLWGGAILNVYHPDAEFINCTFYNNLDGSGNSIVHAGNLFQQHSGTKYINSIIWDDIAVLEGDLGEGENVVFGSKYNIFSEQRC